MDLLPRNRRRFGVTLDIGWVHYGKPDTAHLTSSGTVTENDLAIEANTLKEGAQRDEPVLSLTGYYRF